MSKELGLAVKAAEKAGKISMRFFRNNPAVEKKQDNSPVTVADKQCERVIVETIRKGFPSHSFLGEEFGAQNPGSEFTWIIDPIDGTKNFARGLPDFGVSIALRKGSQLALGVMLLPVTGEIYTAEKGRGARLDGKRIHVSNISALEEAVVYFDVSKTFIRNEISWSNSLAIYRKAYAIGVSGGLQQMGEVACGRADAYIGPHLNAWDIAAGKIIIEEACGRLTDFAGTDSLETGNCVASNGLLHGEILRELNRK